MVVSNSFELKTVTDGTGVSSVKEQWQIGASATVAPTGTWLDTAPVPTRTKKYLWKRVTTTFTDGTTNVADPVVASVYTPGRNYYPDGEYSSYKNYRMTAYSAPFVYYNELYYALTNESTGGVTGVNPQTDVANKGGNWEVFDTLEYVMTKVLFADWGKLASAIFYEEFMMSQYGTNVFGDAVETIDGYKAFEYYNPMGGAFRPNILLNFLTGESWFRKANVEGGITAGSMSYRVKTGGGDLTGYGMASGEGSYILPDIIEGQTLQVRAMCANYSRTAKTFAFHTPENSGTKIYVRNGWSESFGEVEAVALDYNILYTFTSAYDNVENRWVWILTEGFSANSAGESMMIVDDAISSTSINPVQNRAIYEAFQNLGPFTYSRSLGYWTFNGNILVTGGITSQNTSTSSDIRYKEVHKDLELSLEKMADAPSLEFHFKDDESKKTHIGTSAQYWQDVDGVVSEGEDGKLSMDYSSLGVSMAISLAKEVRSLREEMANLKKELELLKNK